MKKKLRTEIVAVRFTPEEFELVEGLRNRICMATNGKMIRQIVLMFATNKDFDFLLQLDPEKEADMNYPIGLVTEQINLIKQMLEAEGIIDG